MHVSNHRIARLSILAVLVLAAIAVSRYESSSQDVPNQVYLPIAKNGAVRVKRLVGPDGGTIEVDVGNLEGVRLEIPPGALAEPTVITLVAGGDISTSRSVPVGVPVDLGPHGLRFLVPATLTLLFHEQHLPTGVGTEGVYVVRQGRGLDQPERHRPHGVGDQQVTLRIDGFSTYQAHATMPRATGPAQCPVPDPVACEELTPDDGGAPQDKTIDRCYIVKSGNYTYDYVNVVDGGTLWFEDEGWNIDFRVRSMLVEQGGAVKAGAWCEPFGTHGGRLSVGLWGADPDANDPAAPAPRSGITCIGQSDGCYASALTASPHYCTGDDPDDPCAATAPPQQGDNALFEGYGNLSYDDNPFGQKVLAVSYGGTLELFGRKGVAEADATDPAESPTTCTAPSSADQHDVTAWAAGSGLSWSRLDASASAGADALTVDRAVDWEPGDEIVVTTTDWHPSHSERHVVKANDLSGHLTLTDTLEYPHHGSAYSVPQDLSESTGNPNTEVDMRAAVGLLTRSIAIRSLGTSPDDPFPAAADCGEDAANRNCYFGGHVIARQGFASFQVRGVEFHQLGQGGRMGHYPVHFHMAKSTAYTSAFVEDSSVWESNTRFIVLHATHDVTLARNVGYLSVGHGFYLEDGSEINNLLCHNLGVSARASLKEYYETQDSDSPTHRAVPPILDHASGATLAGGDTFMPVMYWTMNTWNEIVGNMAAGVHGYGSCFWLLGSGLGGASADLTWTEGTLTEQDYAGFNLSGGRQAPLKRFRGNSCTTSAYALQTTFITSPTTAAEAGFTAVASPYALTDSMRPKVSGDYVPTNVSDNPNCQQNIPPGGDWSPNADACSMTVIDRFTTSFNWSERNFGSVWLRPRWYAFVNSAITDQLFGGLGFVSGGSWSQAPPGYFTLTKDSVFVGSTQDGSEDGGSEYAAKTGPAITSDDCERSGSVCVIDKDGVGLFRGGFNPKRMMTIYDGPFYADGNIFTETAAFDCDPTDFESCGIYLSTIQPMTESGQMRVMDAAIGWKQPNGFYYPPAFAFRNSGFGPSTDRHNVIDQYEAYIEGTPSDTSHPSTYDPLYAHRPDLSSIDFSTILVDLDGTLTGVVDSIDERTSSVSRNHFFDAPSLTDECLSFGVQTSPYDHVTTVAAKIDTSSPSWSIDDTSWNAGVFPAVPIYRQLALDSPDEDCASDTVCDGSSWGCRRGSFMSGGQNGEAPYLTANHGIYYIDTHPQEPTCVSLPGFHVPDFDAGATYALYHLFATEETSVTYQVYVGDGFDVERDGKWVRVHPHVSTRGNDLAVELSDLPGGSVSLEDGVLTVVLDNSLIADEFGFASRADDEKCLPRDICAIAEDGDGCTLAPDLADSDLADTLRETCEYWATATAGATDATEGLSLADCPSGGCLGFSFTLPSGFTPVPYSQVGRPRATCFPDDATWNVPLQRVDEACPVPDAPGGFCSGGA